MRIIDLTQTLKPGMRGFSSEPASTVARDGWNAQTLHIYTHAGTHVDAPVHFDVNPTSIDQMPVDAFVAECWVVNASGVAPKTLISVGHLGDIANKLLPGEGLLFKTDWCLKLDDPFKYRDALPRISEELATWCIRAGVKLIGVEPPSVADINNMEELTRIHTLLLSAGITIVEGLVNLEEIRQEKVQFFALPIKIQGGDGAPCRAIAVEW
jgi:arylformamidase